jgi:HK97 family phage major capsid protein
MPAELVNAVQELTGDVVKVADKVERVVGEVAEMKKSLAKPRYQDGRVPAEPRDRAEENRWTFKSLGDFAHEVKQSGITGGPTDRIRKAFGSPLVQKSATGMGELIGSDGGFLVPPDFSTKIFERLYDDNELLKKTDSYTVTGNGMVFPRNNETSRANGSRWGGVRAYWRQEGTAGTSSKPTFGQLSLNLHKLFCIAVVTSELMEDTGSILNAYLNRAFASEIAFQVGDAIVNGNGAGQPLGILNAPALVTVDKESGQAAATITHANIVKMWARRFGNSKNYVWLVNRDTTPQLNMLAMATGTYSGVASYLPPGGLSGTPYATLLGAPVIETEFNATLGTVGDILLVDLSQYVTITKGGVDAQTSMHLYFDRDEQAFRVTYRVDGQPWAASALTPYKGTATQSHFVALQTRS